MTAADEAYEAAVKEIRRVKDAGEDELRLVGEDYRALHWIPDEIADLKRVNLVDLGRTSVADLAPLARMTWLDSLSLSQTSVTDLSPLKKLTALHYLALDQTDISVIDALAGLTGLQTLWLSETKVTGLSPIANLSALNFLALDGTEVTDISPLGNFKGLRNLHLARTGISDLSPLAELTALQVLWLYQTAVADISPLADLTALETLFLDGTAVTDVAPLSRLTRLTGLHLSRTSVANLSPLVSLTSLKTLWLDYTAVSNLSPIAGLKTLQALRVDRTAVTDLSPLAGLTALETLSLGQTAVTDISPLAGLTELKTLSLELTSATDLTPLSNLTSLRTLTLDGSLAIDLRPLCRLTGLADKPANSMAFWQGLRFLQTPATASDAELARLAEIGSDETRSRETLAYLNTLPPWPEPYTPKARPDGQPPQPIGKATPVLTLEALIQAQDLAGWRFSPSDGAFVLYIRDLPLQKRQEQLAQQAAQRCAKLLASLGGRTNSGGLRQEVWEEAGNFAGLLSDNDRSLSERQLELWGSLVAIGDLLEANERGRRDGRDNLDLLPDEARAALSTFLAMASNLVRSFPEARAMDDDHGSFVRRGATQQLVMDILQDAVRSAVVSQDSANLIGKVAGVAASEGKQAEKASTASVRGLRNLIVVTTLVGSTVGATVGGFAGGVLEDIGGDVSNHFGLGEKAIGFLEDAGDKLEELFDALPPDEAANLRAKLQDFQAARDSKP